MLLHAYRIGFSHTFNELMVIGAVIAFVGAVLTLVLVRQRDFVHNMVGAARARKPGLLPAAVRAVPRGGRGETA